jgi:2-C-methyl-D-erythritol 4-phosphate cytidylyltransferase
VVVAAPPDDVDDVRALLDHHPVDAELTVVPGGPVRRESVRLALESLPPDVGVVLVHDAARPFVPVELVDAVAAAVRDGVADAIVPVLPVTDTVTRVDAESRILGTVDRATVRLVQTPQGFRRDVLAAAHAAVAGTDDEVATDDAGLVERRGGTVAAVPGAEEAFKVTRPLDLMLAEALLSRRRAAGAH